MKNTYTSNERMADTGLVSPERMARQIFQKHQIGSRGVEKREIFSLLIGRLRKDNVFISGGISHH